MFPVIRLANQIAVSNFSELKAPYRITYALTYRCQFTCTMCGIGGREMREEELSVGEIYDFFSRAPGFSWVNLSGGEIFLRTDLLEVIRAITRASRHLYLLNFPTNGYLTDIIPDIVKEIVGSFRIPRLMITVSLDGPPHLHDRIRNMSGSWDRAVETYQRLRSLKSENFDVFLGMTLQDANVDAFEETVRSVRECVPDIQYRDLHVNVMHTSSHYYCNTNLGGIIDTDRFVQSLRTIERLRGSAARGPVAFLERRYQRSAEVYLRTGRTPVPCQALAASLFMDPAGTIYPCTIHGRAVGNIRDFDNDLTRLWASGQRNALRQDVLQGNCPQCWTPCEAYQSILANVVPAFRRR